MAAAQGLRGPWRCPWTLQGPVRFLDWAAVGNPADAAPAQRSESPGCGGSSVRRVRDQESEQPEQDDERNNQVKAGPCQRASESRRRGLQQCRGGLEKLPAQVGGAKAEDRETSRHAFKERPVLNARSVDIGLGGDDLCVPCHQDSGIRERQAARRTNREAQRRGRTQGPRRSRQGRRTRIPMGRLLLGARSRGARWRRRHRRGQRPRSRGRTRHSGVRPMRGPIDVPGADNRARPRPTADSPAPRVRLPCSPAGPRVRPLDAGRSRRSWRARPAQKVAAQAAGRWRSTTRQVPRAAALRARRHGPVTGHTPGPRHAEGRRSRHCGRDQEQGSSAPPLRRPTSARRRRRRLCRPCVADPAGRASGPPSPLQATEDPRASVGRGLRAPRHAAGRSA